MFDEILSGKIPLLIYVLVGAAVCFCRLRDQDKKIFGLSDIVTRLVPWPCAHLAVELIIFISIGCLLAHGLVQPTTPAQAFAAGLAWTGLASTKSPGEVNENV